MAINPRLFGQPVDLSQNELRKATIENLSADPGSPVKGQIYLNTATNKLRVYNGSTWDEMGTGGGGGTGISTGISYVIARGGALN